MLVLISSLYMKKKKKKNLEKIYIFNKKKYILNDII